MLIDDRPGRQALLTTLLAAVTLAIAVLTIKWAVTTTISDGFRSVWYVLLLESVLVGRLAFHVHRKRQEFRADRRERPSSAPSIERFGRHEDKIAA